MKQRITALTLCWVLVITMFTALPWTPAKAAVSVVNTVRNPSLEVSSNTTTPDCFQEATFGTSTGSFERVFDSVNNSVTEPRSGLAAHKVTISSINAGANRKILTSQDSGTCAPTGDPGHSYTGLAWLKGSGTARILMYYRSSGGTWTTWETSSNITLSGTWTPYSLTTDDLPSGATHISVAASLDTTGNMSVDDYSLSQNLTENPSLESSSDSNNADCWGRSVVGTNTATWTRSTDARTGTYSQEVEITSYTDGNRKLYSTQDTGTCAPAVTPGYTYAPSIWVKGSGTARLFTYYRSSGGTWTTWEQTGNYTLSGTWQKMSLTTAAVPAGATHISIAASLQSTGTMIVDDGALTSNTLFADNFSGGANGTNNVITNEYAYWSADQSDDIQSESWGLDSGTLFYDSSSGAASNKPGDECSGGASPDNDSSNCNNNAYFRLHTKRHDFQDAKVEFDLNVDNLYTTSETPSVDWDGVHVFLRHRNQHNLYYASINRRDETVVIKKKCVDGGGTSGTYYTLATAGSNYDWQPSKLDTNQAIKATILDDGSGGVDIAVYADGNLKTSVKDTGGAGQGCSPITQPGAVGVLTDNANVLIDNFTVKKP